MEGESGGNRRQSLAQTLQFLDRYRRIAQLGVLCTGMARPVDGRLALVVGDDRVMQMLAGIERCPVILDHLIVFAGRQHTLAGESLGIQLACAGMGSHFLVHQRLRDHRFIRLVVTEFAEADDVDHNILLEFLAEFHRHFGDKGDCLRVIAIDVEDRCLDHLENVGAVQRRTQVTRIGSGEPNLVVDDNMHRTARAIATRL